MKSSVIYYKPACLGTRDAVFDLDWFLTKGLKSSLNSRGKEREGKESKMCCELFRMCCVTGYFPDLLKGEKVNIRSEMTQAASTT